MDAVTFEKLLLTFEKDLYSFCCYLAAGKAADLYQDTVLAAFEMRAKIDISQNPKSLFFSIAVGKWKNAWRKEVRRQAKVPELPLAEYIAKEPECTKENDPESQVLSTFAREAIRDALADLDDKFRIPLILHYFDDWPLGDIAQICNIPRGTVKSRLHKGRTLLKAALEKEGFHG